jgi:outer membrane lipase/esterase
MKLGFALPLLLSTCLAGLPQAATAGALETWYLFGDSLSDEGRLFEATGGLIPPPLAYFEGRSSNGPVWPEYLPERIDVQNLAVTGAQTGDTNVWDGKLGQFDGLADQVDDFVSGGPADPDGLYVVFAGSNNFLSLPADPVAAISQAITDIVTAVLSLESAGAQRFLVPNLPDFGLTPRLAANPFTSAVGSQFSDAFNAQLADALDSSGIENFRIFDTSELLRDLVGDPAAFGLSVVDMSCMTLEPFSVCANPEAFLFWDDVHPTTLIHEYIAGQVLAFLPEPGAVVLVGLALGALAGMRIGRRG